MQKQAFDFFKKYQRQIDECILTNDFDYILFALEEFENVPHSEFDNFCAIVFSIIDSYEYKVRSITDLTQEELTEIAKSDYVKEYVLSVSDYNEEMQKISSLQEFIELEFVEGYLFRDNYFKDFYAVVERNSTTLYKRTPIE